MILRQAKDEARHIKLALDEVTDSDESMDIEPPVDMQNAISSEHNTDNERVI